MQIQIIVIIKEIVSAHLFSCMVTKGCSGRTGKLQSLFKGLGGNSDDREIKTRAPEDITVPGSTTTVSSQDSLTPHLTPKVYLPHFILPDTSCLAFNKTL